MSFTRSFLRRFFEEIAGGYMIVCLDPGSTPGNSTKHFCCTVPESRKNRQPVKSGHTGLTGFDRQMKIIAIDRNKPK
jgi:hypothetical protein